MCIYITPQAAGNKPVRDLKERLLQETGSINKVGINKFEIVLEEFHLNGNVKEPIRRILIELCEIRNVLVHKCGIADTRFIEKCSWLNYEIGQRLVPNYADFRLYSDGALWYLLELSQRMTDAYHPDEHEKVTDLLADIEKQIDSSLSARKVANSPANRSQ